MLNQFTKYLSIGVINTLIHWSSFASLVYIFDLNQSVSNLIAFCIAVTFSFFANAKVTFKSAATPWRYCLYILFMGAINAGIGRVADVMKLAPFITLIASSLFSLTAGFFYSHYIVFRKKTL